MVNPGGAEKVQVCVLQLHLNKAHTWGIHPPNLFWMAPAPPQFVHEGICGTLLPPGGRLGEGGIPTGKRRGGTQVGGAEPPKPGVSSRMLRTAQPPSGSQRPSPSNCAVCSRCGRGTEEKRTWLCGR